ncbi:MAG: tetraacyldisaccharide 4'-kinase [Flavobacterium sp.]|nr:tetraacyldisaccharide 4'-kinase [Flavobacterium sp.]
MLKLRKMLFPFSILYSLITTIRNILYNNGILKSHIFDIPIIAVGNLSVGGTGKTPQIEYLIRLLSDDFKIATLSRGYKRKSKGFVLASKKETASTLGDEPFQFYEKFKNIQVAVDADRKNGIEQLLLQNQKPNIILLDDAFQHRKVKAGFYILLTTYTDLFCDDFVLPTGNLRENKSGVNRADVIIITKCPHDLSEAEIEKTKFKVKKYLSGKEKENTPIFFSYVDYDETIYSENNKIKVHEALVKPKLLIAGIAKPEAFYDYLESNDPNKNTILTFPDHHNFTNEDVVKINEQSKNKIIVTTEKDYVRLKDKLNSDNLYYLPIKSAFIKDSFAFDKLIISYAKSTIKS